MLVKWLDFCRRLRNPDNGDTPNRSCFEWRLDLALFVHLLDNDGRSWLESRAPGWPPALHARLDTALRGAEGAPRRAVPPRAVSLPPEHGRATGGSPSRKRGLGDGAHYRALASAILASAAWEQTRGRSRRARRRVLGRLMRRALTLRDF